MINLLAGDWIIFVLLLAFAAVSLLCIREEHVRSRPFTDKDNQ